MVRLYAFGVFMILSMLVTSCVGATPLTPNAVETPEMQPERVLVLWTHEFPTFTAGLKEKWIPEFEASHPGVRVEYTAIPYSGAIVSFDTRLLAEVSSGGGPDVWAMASNNFTQAKYIEAGLLAPLDPEVFGYDSVEELKNDYPENSLSVFIKDGKIYALLNELTTLCLYYNQNMFDEAGIPYLSEDKPASWQTIGEISQSLLESDPASGEPTQMGYQFGFFANYPAPEWYIQNFYPVMRQYGQNDLFVNGEPAANSDAMINAFRHFYDFTYTYRAYDPNFVTDWFSYFANDRVAMVTAGPWFTSAIRAANPDVRFGVAPHPVVDPENPDTYQNIMYSFGWVVNANRDPEQQKLAQEFLAFILGKRGEAEQPLWWLKNVGVIQPRSAFLESPGYQQIQAQDPWMKCFIDTFDEYSVDYYQHSSDEAGLALTRAMDRVVYNKMSPEGTSELLQDELLLLP
jgi:ABC-type glycerol-3-phosphate transport system substrate-binding protein